MLDGVGVGELPDADHFNDVGSNTLGNLSLKAKNFELPNFRALGLGNIIPIRNVEPVSFPTASFGKMNEISKGKDSTTGHWELAGLPIKFEFSYYPNGFPKELMDKFLKETGCKGFLGNKVASGTEIIKELGDEHVRTGFPIIYTSADSVFQIAAHEEVIPLNELDRICKITRTKVITPPHIIGRVISRPFITKDGKYVRTTNRHDYSMDPPGDTMLDVLQRFGVKTIAVGKISDLFNHRGISESYPTKSNLEGFNKTLSLIKKEKNSLIFVNLVDFDVHYGHRNDVKGFANALMQLDAKIPELINSLSSSDALVITADHGNDPTTPSTDHSREYVPLLFYRKNKFGAHLGVRNTFSDVAKTACDFFSAPNLFPGVSFI